MNRVSAALLGLSAVCAVVGTAMWSPAAAWIVAAVFCGAAGVANLDVKGKP